MNRNHYLTIAMGFAVSLKAFAQGESYTGVIPVAMKNGRPYIQATLNDKGPFKFMFETGAGGNMIDEQLADSLRLEKKGMAQVGSPGSDATIDAKVYAASLRLGEPPYSFATTFLSTPPMLDINGALSYHTFDNYSIGVNLKNGKISISPAHLLPRKNKTLALEDNEIVAFKAEINGKKILTHLDLGNPGGFDLPYGWRDSVKLTGELKKAGMIRTPAGVHVRWAGKIKGTIKIGKVIFKDPEVNFIEGFEAMNMGTKIMEQLYINIDAASKLIAFSNAENSPFNK